MKDEKKVKATEEAEEEGVQLTDEELSKVSGGKGEPNPDDN